MNLSKTVEEVVFELNQNTLCIYVLSKGNNSGISGNINLELSGKDKGDDQLTKSSMFAQHYNCYYHTITLTTLTGNLAFINNTMCMDFVKRAYLKNGLGY